MRMRVCARAYRPIAMMIFMVILSVQSSSMLCEAMAAMPNNARFQVRAA